MTGPAATFYYFLRTQYENQGDLVINRECLKMLRSRGTVRIEASGVPAAFLRDLDLGPGEVVNGPAFWSALLRDAVRGRAPWLVLVPGGLSGKDAGLKALRQLVPLALYTVLCAGGVRIVRLGISFGPFSPSRARIEAWKSRFVRFFGVRDARSLAYARGIGARNFGHFPDFGFAVEQVAAAHDQSPTIVISLRARDAAEEARLTAAIETLLAQLDPEGRRSLIFATQVDRDIPFAQALRDRFASSRAARHVDQSEGMDHLLALYGASDWLLTNRLHVFIFALANGAQPFALVDPDEDHKIIGLLGDSGMAARLIDISDPAALDRVKPDDRFDGAAVLAAQRETMDRAIAAIFAEDAR